MLALQEFLNAHQSDWKELLTAAPYNLIVKEKGNLVLFKYNQISSDFNEKICKEARGIILEKGTWRVVRIGFNKFFNLGEPHADTIDWSSATATMKEDGSLISLYFYNGWQIATNGNIYAELAELGCGGYKTFKELALAALVKYHDFDVRTLNPNYTYTLEICSPFNKIVCDYPEITLFHTLTRDNRTLEEVDVNIGIPKPKFYHLNSESEYKELVDSFPENTEGIVVKDQFNNRVKLKTKLYFELHRIANNGKMNLERVIDLIRENDYEELLVYFPSYRPYFEEVKAKLESFSATVEEIRIETTTIKNELVAAAPMSDKQYKKLFAERVKARSYSVLYFKAYDGKLDSFLQNLTTAQFIRTFKLEDTKK